MGTQANNWTRRNFLVQGSAALGLAAAKPLAARALQPATKQRKVLHIIGHSHIDAAWLWPWRDGADTALTTMRSALNRINETPGFCYSHSSAAHYRWVQRADPEMFEQIRQRLVSTSRGFNPDSFGHAAGLPTILSSAGYEAYVFMRPQKHEMKLPFLFWWEGPDGSRVLTLRIYQSYDAAANTLTSAVAGNFAPGIDHAAFFLGVGDHGGAITIEQIRQVQEFQKDPDLPELRWSTVAAFLAAAKSSPGFSSLPVVRGELQHHARWFTRVMEKANISTCAPNAG